MNVRLFPGYRFPTQLTVHGLGVFAASNSNIVHLWSLYPSGTPQLLLADATAAKVGLVSKLWCRGLRAQHARLERLSEPYSIS